MREGKTITEVKAFESDQMIMDELLRAANDIIIKLIDVSEYIQKDSGGLMRSCLYCGEKPLPCPRCGKPAVIHAWNMIICSDTVNCGIQMDWGHHIGYDKDGVPAVHWIIKAWNTRK